MSSSSQRPLRVGIFTLGCDKNTVDNEYLAGLLADGGCEPVAGEGDPEIPLDAAVVTTCGFIEPAREQSLALIEALAELRRETGSPRRLFIAGCLTQRYGREIMAELPEIDGVAGVGQFRELAAMILDADAAGTKKIEVAETPSVDIYKLMRRVRLDDAPHAFLKISDGCNHNCAFCSIPIMKGRLRSVPPEILIDEARALVAGGAREINLVAQDLSMYGLDRPEWDKSWRLPRLLRELCAIEGDFWIRCLYFYPGLMTDEFLDTIASEPKIVNYLDMPLQHLDPGVLGRMKRPFHDVDTLALIRRMRERVPGLVLRTTLIAGFPGESAAEHKNMLALLREARFDCLGAFEYSPEDGTPAAEMPRQISAAQIEKRWHAIMRAQQPISAERNAARVGQTTRVLVEGFDPKTQSWAGRSPGEAPEIDGKIFLRPSGHAPGWTPVPGEFVDAEIIDASVYDVFARCL